MPSEETAEAAEELEPDADEERTTMADIDHEPPNEDVNDVWARGERETDAADETSGDD